MEVTGTEPRDRTNALSLNHRLAPGAHGGLLFSNYQLLDFPINIVWFSAKKKLKYFIENMFHNYHGSQAFSATVRVMKTGTCKGFQLAPTSNFTSSVSLLGSIVQNTISRPQPPFTICVPTLQSSYREVSDNTKLLQHSKAPYIFRVHNYYDS